MHRDGFCRFCCHTAWVGSPCSGWQRLPVAIQRCCSGQGWDARAPGCGGEPGWAPRTVCCWTTPGASTWHAAESWGSESADLDINKNERNGLLSVWITTLTWIIDHEMDYWEAHKNIIGQFVQGALPDFKIPNLNEIKLLNIVKGCGEMSYICGRFDLLFHHSRYALHLLSWNWVTSHVQARALHLALARSQLSLVRTSSLFSMSFGRPWKWKWKV